MSSNGHKIRENGLSAGQPARHSTLRRLFSYAMGVWGLLVALAFCIVGSSLCELAVPWILGFMVFDRVIGHREPGRLPFVLLLLSVAFLGQRIFNFSRDILQELANQRLVNKVRCDLYEHTITLPVRFFDRGRTGDLLSRVTGDVDTVESFLDTLMQDIGSEVVVLFGTLSALFAVSVKLTLFLLPTVVALATSVLFFRKPVKKFSRLVRNLLGDLASLAEEAIVGVRVVKAFCAEKFELARFSEKSKAVLHGRVRAKKLASFYSSSVELCVFAGTLIVVMVATPWVLVGAMSAGALVAYLGYVNKLYSPVKKLSKTNLSIQKILAAADRVFEVMDNRPEPVDGFGKQRRPVSGKLVPAAPPVPTPAQLFGAVHFDRVCFSYEPNAPVLKNFSLYVKPGEMVALVGPSGSGKTTIVNLLLRFYEPSSGRILIDGVPIDRFPTEALRRQIGIVSQETFLFSGSIRDNIAYANPAATEDQLIAAARAAHAHDFIMRSAGRYASEAGERGVQLSGGQRQRIAIARALLRNPRIMIFDEATSHLDSESERLIQEALEKLARGRTVFVVAHRLSTIRRADKIVVIEGGEIVEIGRHEDLLARQGTYQRLYTLQVSTSHGGQTETDRGIGNA